MSINKGVAVTVTLTVILHGFLVLFDCTMFRGHCMSRTIEKWEKSIIDYDKLVCIICHSVHFLHSMIHDAEFTGISGNRAIRDFDSTQR